MILSEIERQELESLRLFKKEHEGKALSRAFAKLDQLIHSAHDPMMSIRTFRVIGECLICLRDEITK